jgi:transcriptional regulator with XRE-family HTH domain
VPGRRRRPAPESALRTARLKSGLSQAELAAMAGLSPGWISLLERTPSFMTGRTLHFLAKALGVPEDELRPQAIEAQGPS